MGAYSPTPIIDKDIENKIIQKIVKPTLRALKKEKILQRVFIYRFDDQKSRALFD